MVSRMMILIVNGERKNLMVLYGVGIPVSTFLVVIVQEPVMEMVVIDIVHCCLI